MAQVFRKAALATLSAMPIAIVFSDTVAGMCGRMALAAPLIWSGIVDVDTAAEFVIWSN